jgi:pyruvate-ferredoxin/flavodoxin oxidoreductase
MSNSKKIFKTMDGNEAAAYAAYAFTEIASIFPITPSSPMAEHVDEWAAHGRKNLFGTTVEVQEMQSEKGAAGAMHGALNTGALTTTFTSSQGMMIMLSNMFKVTSELLPGVFHVASRTVATNGYTIFAGHDDVMAMRGTGISIMAESSVQEVMDLSAVVHATAISCRVPILNFFDGFRTSHELQKIEVIPYEDLRPMLDMDAVEAFRKRGMNPDEPEAVSFCESAEVFMQHRESLNTFYDKVPDMTEHYMDMMQQITGRRYHLFNYTGAPDAEYVVVLMGSGAQTAEETVKLMVEKGEKVGCINVHMFRPWSEKHFLAALPPTVKRIAVLDRTKETGANGEPLYHSVAATYARADHSPKIYNGRYGIASKEFLPSDVIACFDNLKAAEPKYDFTLSITDDVTFKSLPRTCDMHIGGKGLKACKFWGFGSDGTVGANKSAIKIIGDNTDMYAQAYFAYDSKKSGGVTVSHLRFGDTPIKMPFLIDSADFIACHRQSYVHSFNLLKGIKKGGTFLLNTVWTPEELSEKLPASLKRDIAKNDVKFYIIDAVGIAQKIGLGGRINMIMQSAFFKLSEVIPLDLAIDKLKDSVVKSYGKKGQKIVDMNNAAIDEGLNAIVKVTVPADWADAVDEPVDMSGHTKFYTEYAVPTNRLEGDDLPVSIYNGREDGRWPTGTCAEEKRGVAMFVPSWDAEKCIGCNQCSFVCPHAAIRPFLLTPEEAANAPEGYTNKEIKPAKGYKFSIVVSVMDCLGCGSCANICPKQALTMKPFDEEQPKASIWDYVIKLPAKENPMSKTTVIGSQFEQPLLEFTGACAGCAETPYCKVVTQLFGDRMMVANAHGCSSVWGGSAPTCGYTKNEKGHGPAWSTSLFEDNAEYGFGMMLAEKAERKLLGKYIEEAMPVASPELQAAFKEWDEKKLIGAGSRARAEKVEALLEAEKAGKPELEKVYGMKKFLVKRSQWVFGGDGWAYDIGYGGLDHVLAQNEDINILVFDTEVYSNTGGQASKATPTAAVAQFAASGKKTKKKDLGMMELSYGYVYVAQVAMGADKNQFLKAIAEAEAYPGPSLVIGYAPCINHGLKKGQGFSQEEQKRAVDCGYWHLWRYNPALKAEGKNPFTLDSKAPHANFRDFLMSEVRFSSLLKTFPETAEALFEKTEQDAKDRYASYVRMQQSMETEK